MKPLACKYVIVRFSPFPETQEFANVGVVLCCPATGYLDYRLETSRSKRVTDFFDPLTREQYLQSLKVFQGELEFAKQSVAITRNLEETLVRFELIAIPREAVVRVSEQRVLLTEEPTATLDELFDQYVQRGFATIEYVEARMDRDLESLLQSNHLDQRFKSARLGNDLISAAFSFVQFNNDLATKVLKSLNLSQSKPTAIFEHGDIWEGKLRRLLNLNLLTDRTLVSVALPGENAPLAKERNEAANEVVRLLKRLDIKVVRESEQSKILEFAAST